MKFMYLLEGHKAPDHNTLARLRSRVLCSEVGEDLERQAVELLIRAGFVDMATVFIDGTKIEANAIKYTFVWKKGTEQQLIPFMKKLRQVNPKHRPGRVVVDSGYESVSENQHQHDNG